MSREEYTELKDTIQKLRAVIGQQAKEIKRLKGQLKTLNDAFAETRKYLTGQMANYELEEVLSAVKERRKLKKQVKKLKEINGCPKCGQGKLKEMKIHSDKILKSCDKCDYFEIEG